MTRLTFSNRLRNIADIVNVTSGDAKLIGTTTVTGACASAEKKHIAPAPAHAPASTATGTRARLSSCRNVAIAGRCAPNPSSSDPISWLKVTVTSAGEKLALA